MAPRPILKPLPPSCIVGPSSAYDVSDDVYDVDLFTASSRALPFASSSRLPPLDSPHVHFPSTPTLTQMAMTHSPYYYDRKPIEVLPNNLALPERDGREIVDIDDAETSPTWTSSPKCDRGYFYPRSFEEESADREPESSMRSSSSSPGRISPKRKYSAFYHRTNVYAPKDLLPPPLVFDQSSESDSDLCASPPPEGPASAPHISVHFSGISIGPPSPSSILTRKRMEGEGGNFTKSKTRKRQGSSLSLDHVKSRDSDGEACNILGSGIGVGDAFNRTKSRSRPAMRTQNSHGFSSFYEGGLDGCLGGF